MSDHWIILIPEDPLYIPDTESQQKATEYLKTLAPESDEVNSVPTQEIQFHHCGENFYKVRCPHCAADIEIDWWKQRMENDYVDPTFKLASYPLPCCGQSSTLHQLDYDYAQGYGKYKLEAMNPNLGKLEECQVAQLSRLLGSPLRVIYLHL